MTPTQKRFVLSTHCATFVCAFHSLPGRVQCRLCAGILHFCLASAERDLSGWIRRRIRCVCFVIYWHRCGCSSSEAIPAAQRHAIAFGQSDRLRSVTSGTSQQNSPLMIDQGDTHAKAHAHALISLSSLFLLSPSGVNLESCARLLGWSHAEAEEMIARLCDTGHAYSVDHSCYKTTE